MGQMRRDDENVLVRLPHPLKQSCKDAAKAAGVSMNEFMLVGIVFMLACLKPPGTLYDLWTECGWISRGRDLRGIEYLDYTPRGEKVKALLEQQRRYVDPQNEQMR
jgi:hypothetical protein